MPRINDSIESFFEKHENCSLTTPTEILSTGKQVMDLRIPYLFLELPFIVPYREMLEEARNIRDRFYEHKSNKKHGHIGWLTLSLFDEGVVTSNGKRCPVTEQFFREMGFDHLYQVRFSMITAGGAILPHIDRADNHQNKYPYYFSDDRHINIALNDPPGWEFMMEGVGKIPIYEGCAVHLATSSAHAVWNRSTEDRYQILVHAGASESSIWPEILLRSYRRLLTK